MNRNTIKMPSNSSSPRHYSQQAPLSQPPLSINEVSRIVGSNFKDGQTVKGRSRIEYVPYEKKIIEYQEKQYVERVPVKRKIIQYEERKFIEEIPRQVVKTDYYAVQNIKQYFRQIIPEKKIEMVPVERKIKKVQYIPVQKQIIHYPDNQEVDFAKGQSRVVLQKQGVIVHPDAVYRPIDPRLIYNYSSEHKYNPVGYVQDGVKRNFSNMTNPSLFQESTKNTTQNMENYNLYDQLYPLRKEMMEKNNPYKTKQES